MMSKNLSRAINEADVNYIYRNEFKNKFKDIEITSPFQCDGFGVSKSAKLRVLFEFKESLNLSDKFELCKVLAQTIYYIKKFYIEGMIPPSTIFIADRNECVTLHVNDVIKYLDMDLDWSIAPSSAHYNGNLMVKLVNDENIKPFVFNSSDFKLCIDKVKDLTDNVQRKVLVTDRNITEVFRYFDEKVLGKSKLTTNNKANLFVQILVNKRDNYIHPTEYRKTIVTKAFGEISIPSRKPFESFFAYFASSYLPEQKDQLTAVVDRIVEDTTRRKQGEFFTPKIWVDKAHEYITSVYGEKWKEEYVVWDPAWGTGNLTRDYKFKELYASTLIRADIETANQMGYNPEAVKFQYDFLNDDYELLPEGLRRAIEGGRKIIVLMNPPYSAGSNSNFTEGGGLNGMSKTYIGEEMVSLGLGKSKQQLYSQFIYRCVKLNVESICVFSPALLMSGSSLQKLRENIEIKYQFKKGFLMDSAQFADVKSWGLSFTIWLNK